LHIMFYCLFFYQCSGAHWDLHSFPTRRSSDLGGGEGGDRSGAEFSGCAAGQQYVDETLEGVARRQDATLQERGHAPPSCNLTSRSEEHTSELQSLRHLVCRLLLEKKKHKK